MKDLAIVTAVGKKSRVFKATLLAYVEGNSLWSGGGTDTDVHRPIWATLLGTEQELRAFTANLRVGRKAEVTSGHSYSRRKGEQFELLKTAGYHIAWQRHPLGSTVTVYLPDLLRVDPGMVDPTGVSFCILPKQEWLRPDKWALDHATRLVPRVKDDEEQLGRIEHAVALAPLFIAYLDRRTRCPIIPDPKFYAQVICAALTQGLASWSMEPRSYYYNDKWGARPMLGFHEYGTNEAKLLPGIAFRASHDSFEAFLAEQVKVYYENVV